MTGSSEEACAFTSSTDMAQKEEVDSKEGYRKGIQKVGMQVKKLWRFVWYSEIKVNIQCLV